MTRTPKIVSNRLFNGETLRAGSWTQAGRSRKSVPRPCCGWFYTLVAKDGQARWTGVQIGHQARAYRLTGPSTWLRVGQLSWQNVVSLVLGIWEAPSVRDLPRRRGEKEWPHHGPGSEHTVNSLERKKN